jgi:hypothetical protein
MSSFREALNMPSHRRTPVSSALIRMDSGVRRNDDLVLDQCFLSFGITRASRASACSEVARRRRL